MVSDNVDHWLEEEEGRGSSEPNNPHVDWAAGASAGERSADRTFYLCTYGRYLHIYLYQSSQSALTVLTTYGKWEKVKERTTEITTTSTCAE
jgi:hypothetical protein